MTLEDIFDQYLSARRREKWKEVHELDREVRRFLPKATKADWEMLMGAMNDPDLKWLVAAVFSKAPVPKRFFQAMIRAAVYEADPSFNRCFIEPCMKAIGTRATNEALLEYVEKGTNLEKAGAINAMYWAEVGLTFPGNVKKFTIENATPESREAYLKLEDLWLRKRCLFLTEFMANEDVNVRLRTPLHKYDLQYMGL